jgi:hypothetical protein
MSATDTSGTPPADDRKLTPTERLHEVTMTALRRAPVAPEHTVDLTLNAKGDVQIAVAARGADIDEVAEDAMRVFDQLCAKYPRNGATK